MALLLWLSKTQRELLHFHLLSFFQKLLTDEDEARNVNLQLEQDKIHLRIRSLDKELNLGKTSEDSENDSSKSNIADIRLKVQTLARIELGADKYSTTKEGSLSFPANGFAMIMNS